MTTTKIVGGVSRQLYAVRLEGTNCYMPAGRSRGFTNDEPTPDGGPLGPRVFSTRGGAIRAVNSWRKGKWQRVWRYGSEEAEVEVNRKPYRDNVALEVVEVVVCLATTNR